MANNNKQISKTTNNNRRHLPASTGRTNNNGVNVRIGKVEIKIPITINIYNR